MERRRRRVGARATIDLMPLVVTSRGPGEELPQIIHADAAHRRRGRVALGADGLIDALARLRSAATALAAPPLGTGGVDGGPCAGAVTRPSAARCGSRSPARCRRRRQRRRTGRDKACTRCSDARLARPSGSGRSPSTLSPATAAAPWRAGPLRRLRPPHSREAACDAKARPAARSRLTWLMPHRLERFRISHLIHIKA